MLTFLELVAIGGNTAVAALGCFCWCFPDLFTKHIPNIPDNELHLPVDSDNKTYRLDDLLHS